MVQPMTRDPYRDSVINSIPAAVRVTFSEVQLAALQQALAQVNGSSRHLVDVRTELSLYWVRYYIVFLLGRDRRDHVQQVSLDRRRRSRHAAKIGLSVLVVWFLMVGAAVTAFIVLYLIKCHLNIDIFPDKHLRDFLP